MKAPSAVPVAIGVLVVLTLAGGSMNLQRSDGKKARPTSLQAQVGSVPPGEPIRVAMLMQLSDCSGNLRPLSLLWEPRMAERMTLFAIWFVGPVSDSTRIRASLPTRAKRVPLIHAPTAVVRELQRLGHRHTPVLVAYDQEGRVRLTTQTPRSPREYAGLRKILEGLTWIEEL